MLKKVRVIEYFEGDILVELHSISGEVFLEKWADFDHGILVKTSSEELKKYLQGEISLGDLFLTKPELIVADYCFRDFPTYKKVPFELIPKNFLPQMDSFHDLDLRPEDFVD